MQATNTVLLIKPQNFAFNKQTAISNAFQNVPNSEEDVSEKVTKEFLNLKTSLENHGIRVVVIEDSKIPVKPDAVFPNNWISMHHNGLAISYPMLAKNRRLERRPEILEKLKDIFVINEHLDLSNYEQNGQILEGTGSVVFDHNSKLAYACISPRTDEKLLKKLCDKLKYTPFVFNAIDKNGTAIYHTNVMMAIGEKLAIVCLESIASTKEKNQLVYNFKKSNLEIVEISFEQMNNFAGNMLELKTSDNRKNIMVMSQRAQESLREDQINQISQHCLPLAVDVSNIERLGGGSVRCMIAEIFLPVKP